MTPRAATPGPARPPETPPRSGSTSRSWRSISAALQQPGVSRSRASPDRGLPVTTPTTLPHVDAVKAALEGVSLTVYFGGAPPGVEPTDAQPYIVLYPVPGTAV